MKAEKDINWTQPLLLLIAFYLFLLMCDAACIKKKMNHQIKTLDSIEQILKENK